MRILIAEDDLTSRMVLGSVLKKSGYDVVEAVNGAEAWEIMKHDDAPRLAILDWMMPEMDGLDVLHKIRNIQSDNPPYIIMLTAKGEKTDIIAGLDAGANDYLSKPFDTGELRARIGVGVRMIGLQEELVRSRELLIYQATHDPLTGLMNRRAILDRLGEELSRAKRHSGFLMVGMCDIDHFKRFNDRYGHQTGDDVLIEVSHVLQGSLRKYDSLGRIGGEEFLAIIPVNKKIDTLSLFNRLRENVEKKVIETRKGALSVTISIGVACAAKDSDADSVIKAADAAMYRAKESGRNRVVLNESCNDTTCVAVP